MSPDDPTFPGLDAERVVSLIADMGFEWTRETFMQSGVEYTKGVYHWQDYDGIVQLHLSHGINMIGQAQGGSDYNGLIRNVRNRYKLVPRDPETGYGNCQSAIAEWKEFVKRLVERYDGDGVDDALGSPKIKYWEGWNEPNYWSSGGGFWCQAWPHAYGSMDMAHLIKLQKAFYEAVKEADPTALVIGPSVLQRTSYAPIDHRQEFYCNQEAMNTYDIINAHTHSNANLIRDWISNECQLGFDF